MRDDERIYPPGVVPGAVGALGVVAAAVLVCGLIFGALLARCDRPAPVQMMPTPAPITVPTATSSAMVAASQSVRVTIRRPTGGSGGSSAGPITPAGDRQPVHAGTGATGGNVPNWGQDEIVIEMTQAAGATSTAAASASVAPKTSDIGLVLPSHGRLGVLALTAPGILAADWLIGSVTIPAWAVGVPLEVGLDLEGNLEHVGAGVSVGGKGFGYVGGWSRWNLSAQGWGIGAGLRF